MKITVLVENTCAPHTYGLRKEVGLSLLIERAGKRILFDAGASDAFAVNAVRLGIDLATVDVAVLSHHHVDHGGGLRHFLRLNDRAPVVMARRPHGECVLRLFGLRRSVGLEPRLFDEHADRFRVVDGRLDILPGVAALTRIGGAFAQPRGNRRLLLDDGASLRPDPFEHELVLVVHDPEGLTVFTGCSHHGILNMVDAAAHAFPGVPIRAVLGGFHLTILPMLPFIDGSRAQVAAIGKQLLGFGPAHVYTGHCTGANAFEVLKGVLGTRLEAFGTGTCIES